MKINRQFILPVVLTLAAIALLAVGVVPLASQIIDQREIIADRKQARNQLENKIDALSNIDQVAQEVNLKISLEALPTSIPFPESLNLIEKLAERHQTGIRDLNLSGRASSVDLSFTATGRLEYLQRLLTDINKILPINSINDLKLVQIGQLEADPTAQVYFADLGIAVNWQAAPTTIGKPSDPLPVVEADYQRLIDRLREFESFPPAVAEPGAEPSRERAPQLFPG